MTTTSDMDKYFRGDALIGDDYGAAQIEQWFDDEREAYADLGAKDRSSYHYEYHALNSHHGFRHLDVGRRFRHVCGFGSAYGDELLPLRDRIDRVTIIDSSNSFGSTVLDGVPAEFCLANPTGRIDVKDGSFDLITCLGVLHHIPNVSFVIAELARTLSSGGLLLVREPITSMGDWRQRRIGVTKRERGIPTRLFRRMLEGAGLKVRHHAFCVFPPLVRVLERAGLSATNNRAAVVVDSWVSSLMAWNVSYHRTSLAAKFAPASEYFVCEKP